MFIFDQIYNYHFLRPTSSLLPAENNNNRHESTSRETVRNGGSQYGGSGFDDFYPMPKSNSVTEVCFLK